MKGMLYRSLLLPLLLGAAWGVAGCGAAKEAEGDRGGEQMYRDLPAIRQDVIREARRWLGTPYRYNGMDADGMDCSGLVSTAFRRVGLVLPRMARDMFGTGRAVSAARSKPGDLVFFKNTAGKGITHVGILLGGNSFIHSSTTRGVIISRLDEDYYKKHYAGMRDVIGR
ncbi:MAG: C40 family peptidase [Ignavibacteriae bacterium]|nr:C40 family peptidase [Ignavibacteriota bacterium]